MASNKSTLINLFAQGDVPQGSDFANMINSQVNMAETALQSITSPLQATEINSPLVSAGTINAVNTLTAPSFTTTDMTATNYSGTSLSLSGVISAGTINSPIAQITSVLTISCDVSANASNVYCSGTRYAPPIIVSAIGTTQSQAQTAQLTATICRGQGVTDGQATGFSLLANRIGWVQYFRYEGTVSANLWPPTGGSINNLGANTAFALAGGTSYTIFHVTASAYGVK